MCRKYLTRRANSRVMFGRPVSTLWDVSLFLSSILLFMDEFLEKGGGEGTR